MLYIDASYYKILVVYTQPHCMLIYIPVGKTEGPAASNWRWPIFISKEQAPFGSTEITRTCARTRSLPYAAYDTEYF